MCFNNQLLAIKPPFLQQPWSGLKTHSSLSFTHLQGNVMSKRIGSGCLPLSAPSDSWHEKECFPFLSYLVKEKHHLWHLFLDVRNNFCDEMWKYGEGEWRIPIVKWKYLCFQEQAQPLNYNNIFKVHSVVRIDMWFCYVIWKISGTPDDFKSFMMFELWY